MRQGNRTDRRGRATIVVALAVILVCAGTATAWAVARHSVSSPVTGTSARASASAAPGGAVIPMPTPSPSRSSPKPTKKPTAKPKATKRAAGSATSDGGGGGGTTTGSSTAVGRLFAADSPWNTPIPGGAAVDAQSAAISKAVLANPDLVVNMAVYAYGIPFYTATSATPRVVLGGRGGGATIPLDPSWAPNEGGDHKLNVIDPATDSVYELQGYDQATESAYWMVKRNIASGSGDGTASNGRSGPTGSGMTQAGGVIRISELRAGRIDHALSFISSSPLAGRYRYPATHTDGSSSASVGMEEGMRVQLDPSLDLGSLHLSKAEYAIARALQVYGAYCVDNGGGNNQAMGFYAEEPTKATGDPYATLGIAGDWAQLKGIPRTAYRVLAASVTQP